MSAVPVTSFPEHGDTPSPRLCVRDLNVSLGRRVILSDVSIDLAAGEIVGILGPNGSGKTTLLKSLVGLVHPERGTTRLDGTSLRPSSRALRARIGVVFQEPSLDIVLTGRENLHFGAALYGVRGAEARARAEELLRFMELHDRADQPVRTYSGGMRRRLELARALIHAPSVLLLDEPTAGLDPVAFDRTWARLRALRDQRELSILVNTHTPGEAAQCDRLIVLDRGRVVATSTPAHLLTRVGGDVVVLTAKDPEALLAEVLERFDVDARLDAGEVLVEVPAGHELIPRLVETFPVGRFDAVALRRPSLSDAFFHLTGHSLEHSSELAGPESTEGAPS